MTSDSVLLSHIGNNRRRFCSQFEELAYREDLYNGDGIPTEFGTRSGQTNCHDVFRILKSLHDELVSLQRVLTAMLRTDIPNSCMSKLVNLATKKGATLQVVDSPSINDKATNNTSGNQAEYYVANEAVITPAKPDLEIKSPKAITKSARDWTVEEVIAWIKTLDLSSSFDEAVKENVLDGKALFAIEGDSDIKDVCNDLRMTKSGDKLKFKKEVKKLLSSQN